MNASYILVKPATVTQSDYTTDADYQKALTDADSAAKDKADAILSDWTTNTASYTDFAALVTAHSSDVSDSGSYTQIGKHDEDDAVTKWLFDSSRKEGDTTVITVSGTGSYVLRFTGLDKEYDLVLADTNKRSEQYTNWETEAVASYTVSTKWLMKLTKKISYLGG